MSRKDLEDIFAKAKKSVDNATTKAGKASLKSKGITKAKPRHMDPQSNAALTNATPKPSRKTGSSADPFGLASSTVENKLNYTEEGWNVYTPDELNIGRGKDTPECPFDCECCF
jgi:hypothetical protein